MIDMPLDPEHEPARPPEGYDPAIHVTAGELRRARVEVPRHVPDGAWIRKLAVRTHTAKTVGPDGAPLFYIGAHFDEPFTAPGTADPGLAGRRRDRLIRAQGNVILGPKGEPITPT
jgi:hypothetical protein